MKEFVEYLKKNRSEELEALQMVANITNAKENLEFWDSFVLNKLKEMICEDKDLMERFICVTFKMLIDELAIKPDPNHKVTKMERVINAYGLVKALVNLESELNCDIDINIEKAKEE